MTAAPSRPERREGGDGSNRNPASPPFAPPVRRRPWLVVLGVLLITTGALAGTALVQTVGDRVQVLALAQEVPSGKPLTDQDVTMAHISADSVVETVGADQMESVVGATAATDLHPGELLTMSKVTEDPVPEPGHELVAVPLRESQMPSEGLRAGDAVQVVSTPGEGGETPSGMPPSVDASVVRVGEPDMDGYTVVDVQTSSTDGAVLAARVATGRIALVLEAADGDT